MNWMAIIIISIAGAFLILALIDVLKSPKNQEPKEQLVETSRLLGRMSDTVMRHIVAVQSGKNAIIIGKDFVVMSTKEYYVWSKRTS